MHASTFSERLDEKNRALIAALEESEYCRHFFSPATSTALIEALTGSLLQEVASYGPHLTIGICTALGRLASYPKWLPWIRPLMESLLGEVSHPDMARQDSTALTHGTEESAQTSPSPAAFAVVAIARFLCEQRHPLTHLGFFYLLEGTTSAIAPRLQKVLEARGIKSPFVELHAEGDAAHADTLRDAITKIVEQDPSIAVEIEYGYDCFAEAYPMRVWDAAANRALASPE